MVIFKSRNCQKSKLSKVEIFVEIVKNRTFLSKLSKIEFFFFGNCQKSKFFVEIVKNLNFLSKLSKIEIFLSKNEIFSTGYPNFSPKSKGYTWVGDEIIKNYLGGSNPRNTYQGFLTEKDGVIMLLVFVTFLNEKGNYEKRGRTKSLEKS